MNFRLPIKVRNRFLKSQKIVDSTDNDINSSIVSSLCSEVVLERFIVAFTEQLEESEEHYCEFRLFT